MVVTCDPSASLEGAIPFRVHSDFSQTSECLCCFSWAKQWQFSPICWYSDLEISIHLSTIIYKMVYAMHLQLHPPENLQGNLMHLHYSDSSAFESGVDFQRKKYASASSLSVIINYAISSWKQIISYGDSPPSKGTLLFPYLLFHLSSEVLLALYITALQTWLISLLLLQILPYWLWLFIFCNYGRNWRQW